MKTEYKTVLIKMSFDCVVIPRGGSLQLVLVAGGKCVTFSACRQGSHDHGGVESVDSWMRGVHPQNTPPIQTPGRFNAEDERSLEARLHVP